MSIVYNGVWARGKKPPISDTTYSLWGFIRGPVATVGSVCVEGGEWRKELELEDWGEWKFIDAEGGEKRKVLELEDWGEW
jgi:hypothetical protein